MGLPKTEPTRFQQQAECRLDLCSFVYLYLPSESIFLLSITHYGHFFEMYLSCNKLNPHGSPQKNSCPNNTFPPIKITTNDRTTKGCAHERAYGDRAEGDADEFPVNQVSNLLALNRG